MSAAIWLQHHTSHGSRPFSMWRLFVVAAMDLTTLWVGNFSHATSGSTMSWYLDNLGAAEGLVDIKMKHRGPSGSSAAFVHYDSEANAAKAKELAHRFRPSPAEHAWTVKYANVDTKQAFRGQGPKPTPPPPSTSSSSTQRHVALVCSTVGFPSISF